MTRREFETKQFELLNHMDERFKDIQFQSNALKSPEDKTKNMQTLLKIADSIDDIKKTYYELEMLELEDVEDEDEEEDSGYSYRNLF